MTNQENDSQELQPHHENDPPHLSDEQTSTQSIHNSQEEEENPHLQQHNPSVSSPTMISSPPPKPPPSPPPADSSDHTSHSHGYVFSQPEVQQATYQSPPSDYSHTYVISSPPSAPASPPVPASQPKDEQPDKSVGGGTGGDRVRNRRPRISISERNRDDLKRKTLLGFRILGLLFCLISFSVLAADKNQGWALDSFYRYKEFRYCLSINVIGFVYMGLQSYDLAFCLATGKIVAQNQLRVFLDFSFDQILAYLVLSASSTAAFRVEDWESNWGKDKFPAMARSSTVLSFLAFVAFSLCSLLSGHTLFTSKYI